ncbi:MAG: GlsB/YeaQ/YmgE family stress response membrane protein [Actinomycetota bacterium]|nr:GlsB/YeaQ/YmgE family stress response membrane protein [Actinomycetota bacterium]
MGIVALILVGLIAGVLARIAMPGPDPGGIIVTIVVGIVGAFAGKAIFTSLLGGPWMTGFNLSSILVATLGSITLLAIYRSITRQAA